MVGGASTLVLASVARAQRHTHAEAAVLRVVCELTGEPTCSLSAETPLVGEDLGLDSLDLLMVVTGTEKRLGIKIPNDRLGRDTMGTIGAFAIFVDEIRNQT